MLSPLVEVFLANCAKAPSLDARVLDAALRDAVEKARSAWPLVRLEPADFIACLASCSSSDADPIAALARLHHADLYVVCAAARGDHAALAAIEELLSEVPRHVSRIAQGSADADAIRQHVRAALLGASSGSATYSGRGPLRGWIRVSAVRGALNQRRAEARARRREVALPELTRAAADPELDLMKARYRPEVTRAVEDALRALAQDRRTVLRLHYDDELTIDEIATLYAIHRSTAARWISESRTFILDETKRLLRERLRGTPSEIASILAIVKSDIWVSVSRLLSDAQLSPA